MKGPDRLYALLLLLRKVLGFLFAQQSKAANAVISPANHPRGVPSTSTRTRLARRVSCSSATATCLTAATRSRSRWTSSPHCRRAARKRWTASSASTTATSLLVTESAGKSA